MLYEVITYSTITKKHILLVPNSLNEGGKGIGQKLWAVYWWE